jgi:DnaJ-class molecular chaperone
MTINSSHLPEGYDYETCGFCQGTGKADGDSPCPPCKGRGRVAVSQPPITCPRCKGSGKPEQDDPYGLPICVICRGAGWVMTLVD